MHDAEATGKTSHLGGEEGIGCEFSEQRVGVGAALGTNVPCIGRAIRVPALSTSLRPRIPSGFPLRTPLHRLDRLR
jgi:hypothetical protein